MTRTLNTRAIGGDMWTFGWLFLPAGARLVEVSGVLRLRGRHDAVCTDALTGQVLSVPLADAPAYQRVSDADFERLSGLRIPRDWKGSLGDAGGEQRIKRDQGAPRQDCWWIPRLRDPVVRACLAFFADAGVPGPRELMGRARRAVARASSSAAALAAVDTGNDTVTALAVLVARDVRAGHGPPAAVLWRHLIAEVALGFTGDVEAAEDAVRQACPDLRARVDELTTRVAGETLRLAEEIGGYRAAQPEAVPATQLSITWG